jgi:hypothetical protein
MWTRLALCSFFALIQSAAWAQTADSKDLLLRVRANVTDSLARLPKYMCSLTIDRAQYAPDPVHPMSCDGLSGQRKKGQYKPRLAETDRVRLDVGIAAANEIYSWVGEDRFDDRDVFDFVRQGALQTGGFRSFLSSIFGGSAASFSYNGETAVDGRTLAEFGFQVPQEKSGYVFGNRREHVVTGYEGTFLADPKTGDLVRLMVRTSSLPADTGACEATTTLEYMRVRLNDAEFLLPRQADLDILQTDGSNMRNRTAYSSCHEFRGESAMKFDQPAPQSTAAAVSKGPTPSTSTLPGGLPFKLVFTQAIDTDAAAAGDRIRARLGSPIRAVSSKEVLIPEGAEVTARIVRLEHFPGPPFSVTMEVKLETVSVGGMPVPFKSVMAQQLVDAPEKQKAEESRPVMLGGAKMGMPSPEREPQPRIQLGSLTDDPSVGVFEYRDVKPNFVVKSGLETKWKTAAPQ